MSKVVLNTTQKKALLHIIGQGYCTIDDAAWIYAERSKLIRPDHDKTLAALRKMRETDPERFYDDSEAPSRIELSPVHKAQLVRILKAGAIEEPELLTLDWLPYYKPLSVRSYSKLLDALEDALFD